MLKQILSLCTGLILMFPVAAQQLDTHRIAQRIENYLAAMEKAGFYGSVLVECEGKKIVAKGYGYRNIEKNLKNQPTTIFNINSVTKQFTAAAILKLEMQGKLSTTDKISRYFSNVPLDKANITVHDLLRNRSGLVSNVGANFEKISKTDFIKRVFDTKLLFEPGVQFSYSNIGYSLLAIIIEERSGMRYEDYLYQNLLKTAEMHQTGFTRPDFEPNNVAIGYYNDGRDWGKPTQQGIDRQSEYWNTIGNGNLLSNVEDIYKWHKSLLTDTILSAEAKRKLFHPPLRPNEDTNNYYAYGWDIHTTPRHTLKMWHNGVNNIMYADFKRFSDERVMIITLSNKSNQNIFDGKISNDIEGLIFYKDYSPTIPAIENQENAAFTDQIIKIIEKKGLQAGKDTYKHRTGGVDILPHVINAKGYDLLGENKADQAIVLFAFNVFVSPGSADAYDSLAEGLMEKGDKYGAIKNYERSIALNPLNDNATQMLKKLR